MQTAALDKANFNRHFSFQDIFLTTAIIAMQVHFFSNVKAAIKAGSVV